MASHMPEGKALFVRLLNFRKAGKFYTAPDLKIRMAISVANENDGRLLWTEGIRPIKIKTLQRREIRTMIVYSPVSGNTFTATITGCGEFPEPRKIVREGYYPISAAEPTSKQWFALDDVRYSDTFDPREYQTAPLGHEAKPRNLADVIKQGTVSSCIIQRY